VGVAGAHRVVATGTAIEGAAEPAREEEEGIAKTEGSGWEISGKEKGPGE
jgi:hypothetical protein